MKICKNCKTQHDGLFGCGDFCSLFCSNKFGTIYYQSSYELNFIKKCELDNNIKQLSRGPRIEYINPIDNKKHYYYSDFILTNFENNKNIYEIKSKYYFGDNTNKEQQNKLKINNSKFKAAKKYTKKRGEQFKCLIY